MRPLYRLFAEDVCPEADLDFSDEAAWAMYAHETYGEPLENAPANGYFVGKRWLNVQVAEWKIDIAKFLLLKVELYEDPVFQDHHAWLDRVLDNDRLTRS